MSSDFSQEFGPDTQSQPSILLPPHSDAEAPEAGRRVRASFTALGLALSLGATGSLISSAEAADSMQMAALPSVAGGTSTLPSFGSSRPDGASASYHTVVDGETIWDIARQHGLSVDAIKSANGMADGQVIQVGQVLKVPTVDSVSAPVVTDASGVETVEVAALPVVASSAEVSVLPEAVVPSPTGVAIPDQVQTFTLEELQLDKPQVAPDLPQEVALEPVPAAAESVVSDSAVVQAETAEVTALSPAAGETSADLEVLALATESPAESSSMEQFSEQLNAIRETTEKRKVMASLTTGSLSAASNDTLTHRIRAGETIWSLARTYGLDPVELQQMNGIADPRALMPGDKIIVPASLPLAEADLVGRRPLTNEQSMAVTSDLSRPPAELVEADAASIADEQSPALIASADPESLEIEATGVIADDPFVADMLSEVAAASGSREADITFEAAADAARSASADSEAEGTIAEATTAKAVAVNPQFAGSTSEGESIDVDSRLNSEELLAAAPLGSEVYAPVIENPAGRIVTPEMPVMPDQEVYLPEAPNRFDGYMWPTQGVLTSGYGWRWGRMHRGVDIAGPVGTPIYAAGAGVVVTSGWNSGGYGNMVDIRHPDGSLTRYAHNSRLMVSPGQQVRQGQQIAEMGSTGYSTGPHLHFEIHIPNQGTVNPIALLPGR
ncbi:MAG: peptidoglycan DD-metalloendopeptidase family protein [Cyanobacteria bacterium P01_C01_bin.70]